MTEDSAGKQTSDRDAQDASTDDITLPDGSSGMLRRRFLQAMGTTTAAAGIGALAGCTGLLSDDEEEYGGVDYPEMENFKLDWVPQQIVKSMHFQAAFDSDQIYFRFRWNQPRGGGWLHDYIIYDGDEEEWKRHDGPDPWAAGEDQGHEGYYEDRLSFFLDDGSVQGFRNFGGWLTVHMGVRTLPGATTEEDIVNHPVLGDEGYGRNDLRKFIPHSREGEWWENPWDDIAYNDDEMLEDQEVWLDLPMWRAHRSNPMGYGTDHHVTDYRHGDDGDNTFDTQDWDPEDGPEFMFDPDVVSDGALDHDQFGDREEDTEYTWDVFYDESDEWLGEREPFYLHEDWMVEFDPDVAEFDGAAIPRRPLQEPEGSAADWGARGIYVEDEEDRENNEWHVEMWRALQTDNPRDTKQLQSGGVYDFAPALHHGYTQRWHWVAYPYTLGLGEGTDADIHAVQRPDDWAEDDPHERDWDDVPEYTIPLIYPGQADWTWLTSPEHRGYIPTRNDEMSIWDVHGNPRRMAAMVVGQEVGEDFRGQNLE